jgi:type VI secretion system secreted protein Hcp
MRVRSGLAAVVMSAAFALSAIPTAVLAAVDAFLQIDGIKGESQDDKHKGWIEISSFSWGVTNASSIGSATSGAGAGKASMQEIHITKNTDKASPLLMQACANGKHYAQVTLQMRKAGGDTYMTYVLTDVLISSFQASGGGGDNPTESVTLRFARMSEQSTSPVSPPMTRPVESMRRP